MKKGKLFSKDDALLLEAIILNRRDVRGNHFVNDPVPDEIIDKLIDAAINAPSVGFSQPWEFVIIKDTDIKKSIRESFDFAKEKESHFFNDQKHREYITLKLEGIMEAPVNMAVFYKPSTVPVLGQTNMLQAGLYSVVCAIQNMWLMARALNVGMGWVSILNAERVKEILNAPPENELIAYLCIGKVDRFLSLPELQLIEWEKRKEKKNLIFLNHYK